LNNNFSLYIGPYEKLKAYFNHVVYRIFFISFDWVAEE
jgi:hypothetical protein